MSDPGGATHRTAPGSSDQKAGGLSQYLVFTLSGISFAVGIREVREILEFRPVALVPGLPPVILGVINLRGAVVPVLDLRSLFSLPQAPATKQSCIVIVEATLEGSRRILGLRADAAVGVLDLAPGDVEPPPAFGLRIRADHLRGVAKTGGDLALILDLPRMLFAAGAARMGEAEDGGTRGNPAQATETASPDTRTTGSRAGRNQGGEEC